MAGIPGRVGRRGGRAQATAHLPNAPGALPGPQATGRREGAGRGSQQCGLFWQPAPAEPEHARLAARSSEGTGRVDHRRWHARPRRRATQRHVGARLGGSLHLRGDRARRIPHRGDRASPARPPAGGAHDRLPAPRPRTLPVAVRGVCLPAAQLRGRDRYRTRTPGRLSAPDRWWASRTRSTSSSATWSR
jgi:hypothetical protein